MSEYKNITQAFSITLFNWEENDWEIAYPNAEFDPEGIDRFLKYDDIPSYTAAAGCGVDAKNEVGGIAQIMVITETGVQWATAYGKADEVAGKFKRGTVLEDDGVRVLVVRTEIKPYAIDDETGSFLLPVQITYQTFVNN